MSWLGFVIGAIVVLYIAFHALGIIFAGAEAFHYLSKRKGESDAERWRRIGIDALVFGGIGVVVIGFCAVAMSLSSSRDGLGLIACLFFPAACVVCVPLWFLFKMRGKPKGGSQEKVEPPHEEKDIMLEIVIATSNPHKIEEMNAIFAEIAPGLARFRSLAEACPTLKLVEPAETGSTFEANATIKAMSYAEQTGKLCLADDSGLEIDALGGKPGVISSHYSTDGRETGLSRAERDQANNARVLRELETVPDERRGARFVCVMVLAGPAVGTAKPSILASSRGTFEGRMARKPSGGGGFGYDPLFLVAPDYSRSSAELSPAEKNELSHRGAAARALVKALREIGQVG